VSAARSTAPGRAARGRRLIGIVLTFVALGPPIGFFVTWSLLVIVARPENASATSTDLLAVPIILLLIMPFAYLYGVVPAALAGLAIGIKQAFFGRTTWPMALGVGLLVGVIFLEGFDIIGPRGVFRPTRYDGSPIPELPGILILTCVVPTMLCWALVRNRYFAPTPTAGAVP
jgi:hypothetical protein